MSHALALVAIEPTGDVKQLVAENMAPFEEGDCFEDGSRWDWYVIGGRFSGRLLGQNVIRLSDWSTEEYLRQQTDRARNCWAEAQRDEHAKGGIRKMIYGIKEDDTEETLIKRYTSRSFVTAPAFIRNKRWDEASRMGWFGGTAPTECEIAGKDLKRCLWRDNKSEVIICSWNESDEQWKEKFYDRFIKPLDPDTRLVAVDYHV